MTTALVWSERPEPYASSLRDCAYSARLALMIEAGFTAFPLGIYTPAEREALERSDDQPDETGASCADLDVATSRRYGRTAHLVPGADLAAALATPGVMVEVAGTPARLPARHKLRRWLPAFVGAHMWAVRPMGHGRCVVLDPLAPNRYAGDPASVDDVLAFAYGGADKMRMIRRGEFSMHHVKGAGARIGVAMIAGDGHWLLSTEDPKSTRFGPRPDGEPFSVLAGPLQLVDAGGAPLSVDGNPCEIGDPRSVVYLVDAPAFGAAAFVLVGDVAFRPETVASFVTEQLHLRDADGLESTIALPATILR